MLPQLDFAPDPLRPIPGESDCVRLWDKYGMLPNIRAHSRVVADVALDLARRARALGLDPGSDAELRAACLLHDIAKTYTIRHGGGHAQLGAAWTLEETSNPFLAQAVLFHVVWPWDDGPLAPWHHPLRLPFLVSYADKRSRHNQVVGLEERFADLLDRYGHTEWQRASITANLKQARRHEAALAALLGPL